MTNSKIITYDLRGPGRNYDDLIEFIKSYAIHARVTESTWIINTEESCVSLRDKLNEHIDSNDRLFVASLTGEAAWKNTKCNSDYLKEHL